ncbi:MAG TPA: hypothetical protein VFQ77_19955 [Pseudonocardiaceae bacterium]|jgi:alkanesulfonate monooxygenase SsuD/methylene tetrahydromethanopterin reductase-like flavin-dependent oxidoreductase (luciferase family)|nr:hypothetical protein [Pseudonocardiaceae bacterium]
MAAFGARIPGVGALADPYPAPRELAIQAGDHHRAAKALTFAGQVEAVTGHPDHALKYYQLGQATLLRVPGDGPETTVLAAGLHASSASAYARMGDTQQALTCLSRSRDGWEPPDALPSG